MTFSEVNSLAPEAFFERFGELYEHSPWVVKSAAEKRPFADMDAMLDVMEDVVRSAGPEAQLDLFCAHPELAGKAAVDNTLTRASAEEQAAAGLDRMTEAEFGLFQSFNGAYRHKFGFPFIICVKLTTKAGILAAMEARLDNERDDEFQTALEEVFKIVRLRLEGMLS